MKIKRFFEDNKIIYECRCNNKDFNIINYYLLGKYFIENKIMIDGFESGNDLIEIKNLDFIDWLYIKRIELLKEEFL